MNILEHAIEDYGITYDPREAGYILPDGRMLDFSEKNNGGSGGYRTLDHRDVNKYYPGSGQTESMNYFVRDTNSVRVACEDSWIRVDINRDAKITAKQAERIVKMLTRGRKCVTIDFYNTAMDNVPATSWDSESTLVSELMQMLQEVHYD